MVCILCLSIRMVLFMWDEVVANVMRKPGRKGCHRGTGFGESLNNACFHWGCFFCLFSMIFPLGGIVHPLNFDDLCAMSCYMLFK